MWGRKETWLSSPQVSSSICVTKSSTSVNGIIISSGSKKETYNLTCSVKASGLYWIELYSKLNWTQAWRELRVRPSTGEFRKILEKKWHVSCPKYNTLYQTFHIHRPERPGSSILSFYKSWISGRLEEPAMATSWELSRVGDLAPYYWTPGPQAGGTSDIIITSKLLPTDLVNQNLPINKSPGDLSAYECWRHIGLRN